MSRPPPKDLLKAVTDARAELALRVTERKAAWSVEGLLDNSVLLRAWAYHQQHRLWTAARDELARLERQLAAHQAHQAEELAHE